MERSSMIAGASSQENACSIRRADSGQVNTSADDADVTARSLIALSSSESGVNARSSAEVGHSPVHAPQRAHMLASMCTTLPPG